MRLIVIVTADIFRFRQTWGCTDSCVSIIIILLTTQDPATRQPCATSTAALRTRWRTTAPSATRCVCLGLSCLLQTKLHLSYRWRGVSASVLLTEMEPTPLQTILIIGNLCLLLLQGSTCLIRWVRRLSSGVDTPCTCSASTRCWSTTSKRPCSPCFNSLAPSLSCKPVLLPWITNAIRII